MLHHCVAWGDRRHNAPQGCSLRLAADTLSGECALTQNLPVSLSHFRIYVVDKGGVAQDAERLRLAVSNLWMGVCRHEMLRECCRPQEVPAMLWYSKLKQYFCPKQALALGERVYRPAFIIRYSGKWKKTGFISATNHAQHQNTLLQPEETQRFACNLWQTGTFFFNWDKL